MIRGLREWRHLALLAGLVMAGVLEPLSANWSDKAQIAGGMIPVLINITVLLVIFERRWERSLGLFLVIFALSADILHEFSSDQLQIGAIAHHCFGAVFLAFANAVILQRIFRRRTIRTDEVIGALCGYLLAGVAWGHVYALVYLIWPASFHIADAIASQLGNWQSQRFLFNYFSVMTLTTLGYSNISPAGSPVYSLVWLESVFGQFYIAVVVAQLVGLRLAQAIRESSGISTYARTLGRSTVMIGVFVTFRYGDNFDEQAVRKIAETARARFEGMPGLRSKAFTVNSGQRKATNFYVWDSEDAAKAFFTDALLERVTGLYGVRPSIELVQIATLVENARA